MIGFELDEIVTFFEILIAVFIIMISYYGYLLFHEWFFRKYFKVWK